MLAKTNISANKKHIALVAHDGCKEKLCEWAMRNRLILRQHTLYATGTTGKLLEEHLGYPVFKFKSGPFGGDQQIGARITEGEIDCLVFFWDPLTAQPHEHDVRALLRLATLWNIPTACNESTGDLLITSPQLNALRTQSEIAELLNGTA